MNWTLFEVVVLGNQKEVPVSDVVNLHLEPLAVGTHEPPRHGGDGSHDQQVIIVGPLYVAQFLLPHTQAAQQGMCGDRERGDDAVVFLGLDEGDT